MAKPHSQNKPYSRKEKDYILRVAGKVPVPVIANQIKRSPASIYQFGRNNKIKLSVPTSIINKHWPEYSWHATRGIDEA